MPQIDRVKRSRSIQVRMKGPEATLVFAGELEVQDDEFQLQADRLILRKGEIAFAFTGRDVYGPFQMDGVASAVAGDRFATLSDTLFKPRGFHGEEKARVVFNEVELSPKKTTCRVKGLWRQYDDAWVISGILRKAKGTKR